MRIEIVPYDHLDATVLIAELQQEFVARYGETDGTPVAPAQFGPPHGLFLICYLDGAPVGCGGWRAHDERVAELKRMYVTPAARGRGVARAVLAELERTAAAAGHDRMVLETGREMPAAVALYESAGYVAVPSFGYYQDEPGSVHLGKQIAEEPSWPSMP